CSKASRHALMTADCSRATASLSRPAASARKRATPPAAAASRASASMHMCRFLGSVATARSQRNVAGFPAIRAVIEAVGAETDVGLPFANGAVLLASAARLRHVALHTNGRTVHRRAL